MLVAERGLFIGHRLRELRKERAHTQKELAAISEINEVTVSNLERNRQGASPNTVRKLAKALGVEVIELTRRPGAGAPSADVRYPGGAESERDFEKGLSAEERVRRARRLTERGECGRGTGDTSV